MFNNRLNRKTLAAASAALLLYGIAIGPATTAARKELSVTGHLQEAACGPPGNSEFPAIRIAPAGTIPTQVPVGVPLDTKLNERIG